MFKGFINVIAEIIVGIVWCAIMIGGTVLLFLIGYGLLAMFVER